MFVKAFNGARSEKDRLSHIQKETNANQITINVIITEYMINQLQVLWLKASR
jgi:hypothetical protein